MDNEGNKVKKHRELPPEILVKTYINSINMVAQANGSSDVYKITLGDVHQERFKDGTLNLKKPIVGKRLTIQLYTRRYNEAMLENGLFAISLPIYELKKVAPDGNNPNKNTYEKVGDSIIAPSKDVIKEGTIGIDTSNIVCEYKGGKWGIKHTPDLIIDIAKSEYIWKDIRDQLAKDVWMNSLFDSILYSLVVSGAYMAISRFEHNLNARVNDIMAKKELQKEVRKDLTIVKQPNKDITKEHAGEEKEG